MSATDCVKVSIRVRPFVSSELNRGCVQIIEKIPGQSQLAVSGSTTSKIQDNYTFNNVFMPEINQEEVYKDTVQPIIDQLFEGYNVTILAYGQTGSGKTFTMGTVFDGNWDSPITGIIPRALRDIFKKVEELEDCITQVTCSFMELYQENLYDLLSGKSKEQSVCEIREDSQKGIILAGLSEQIIEDESKAAEYLIQGGDNRSVGATAMNDVSSRSHAIFTVNIKVINQEGSTTKAKFHLVDLAGSERSKKTKTTGQRFKEGVKINQGLLALGNVISALGGGSGSTGGYISYRDSKLTRLLQDSLGGNSFTLMIACVSPADYNIEETLSTLRYADRAKKIKNKPVKNRDSHEAEIEKYKSIVQELRMKLLRFSDPHEQGQAENSNNMAVCGPKCKKQKVDMEIETNAVRQQLSELVTVINGLHSAHLLDETFCTELIEHFEALRDLLLATCRAEFAVPDTKIFDEIKSQTDSMEALINKYRNEVKETTLEDDYKIADGTFDDVASAQKRLEYTQTQIESLKNLHTLERGMKIKQDLLDRKFANCPYLNEETEKNMNECLETIIKLEKELEDLKSANASVAGRRDHNATKVNMDRKHKVEKLEKDLEETRKKCVTLEKTKKLAEQDRKRIDDLRREIQEMKTARVQLIRQQRSDADRYKKWITTRDKEINILKEKGKKAQNEMNRMNRMHENKQAVLKRKVIEAKAVNKRLQDAMDRNRKIQAMRTSNKIADKSEIVQTYIDHELQVLMSTIDANIAMKSLMNDRGLLTERLMNLKSAVNKNEGIDHEIKQLEEDLEMRNAQIIDIRQKVAQTDREAKMKSIPDNFHTVAELKIAMSYVLAALMDAREDFTNAKVKAEDIKVAYESSEERIEHLTEDFAKERDEFLALKSQIEDDFETKLNFMCQLNNGKATNLKEDSKEDGSGSVYVSMAKQLCEVVEKNKKLIEDNEALAKELERVSKKGGDATKRKVRNETFDMHDEEFDSDDSEFDINDSFQDPDWVKTPAQRQRFLKRTTSHLLKESITNRMDGTGMLANISETSDTSSRKRSSNSSVKCNCKGSCATKQCGCKKNGNFCTSTACKCSEACVNRPDESDESQGQENAEKNDEEGSPISKQLKMDFNNITTPYYPYNSKKRKPLLQV